MRFKQSRDAYYVERGHSKVKNKCHQLHYALNCFNGAAKSAFDPGNTLSYDEGGNLSRSRMLQNIIIRKNLMN